MRHTRLNPESTDVPLPDEVAYPTTPTSAEEATLEEVVEELGKLSDRVLIIEGALVKLIDSLQVVPDVPSRSMVIPGKHAKFPTRRSQ